MTACHACRVVLYTACSYFASSFFFKKLWSQQVLALGFALSHVFCVFTSDGICAINHVLRVTREQKEGKLNDGHQDFAFMQVRGGIVCALLLLHVTTRVAEMELNRYFLF